MLTLTHPSLKSQPATGSMLLRQRWPWRLQTPVQVWLILSTSIISGQPKLTQVHLRLLVMAINRLCSGALIWPATLKTNASSRWSSTAARPALLSQSAVRVRMDGEPRRLRSLSLRQTRAPVLRQPITRLMEAQLKLIQDPSRSMEAQCTRSVIGALTT